MKKLSPLILLVVSACGADGETPTPTSTPTPAEVTVVENGRYHLLQAFHASLLDNERDVLLYLPPSYESEPEREYPVLYMHDGQNLFYDDTAAYGFAWEVDDIADDLVASGDMDEVIIIGVYNTAARIDEYTPTVDPSYGGGDGPLYADFLIHDLKPWIDGHYRTLTGPDDTAVMGSSLGGLISFWIGWNYPEVFGMSGAVSPSFWWNNTDTLDLVKASALLPGERFYLDIGTAEGEDVAGDGMTSAVQDTRDVRDACLEQGATWADDLAYLEILGAAHNESAWEARVEVPLRWMFGPRDLTPATLTLEPYGGQVGVTGVTTLPTAIQVNYESGLQLTLPGQAAAWTSNPGEYVGIDTDGTLHGLNVGEVEVTAQWAELSASSSISVVENLSSDVAVTFEVTVPPPPENSSQQTVYIVGDAQVLGGWDPAAVPLTPLGGDVWQITLTFPRGSYFSYKYTRGSWGTVEKGSGNQEIENRSGHADVPSTVNDVVARWADG